MKNPISRRKFLASAAAFAAGTAPVLAQNFPPPFGSDNRYPTDRPPSNIDPRGRQPHPQQGHNPNAQTGPIPTGPDDKAAIEQWYLAEAIPDPQFPIRKVRQDWLNPEFRRQLVPYRHSEQPGTLVVDAKNYHLYLLREGGQAIRYGVGVGREGFGWSGNAIVGRVAEWPAWVPPREMRLRQPELPERVEGGYDNPLGARALYLYEGNKDTLYRIHGTAEPWTIGTNVSSGCIRLLNEEIADLYLRTPVGTKVVVVGNQQNIPVQSQQPAPQQIQPQYQQQPQQQYQQRPQYQQQYPQQHQSAPPLPPPTQLR